MNQSCVLALGFFDGVHIGHGALLQKTRQVADRLGIPACALSFDTHPAALISGQDVALLGSMEDRKRLMQLLYGIDEVVFAHFDEAMMRMSWESFMEDYLIEVLHACHVVCGHDFRFGYRGLGTPERLLEKCSSLGLGCDIIPEVRKDGKAVSSSYIRSLLLQGETGRAVSFLGHAHLITGHAEHGVLPIGEGLLRPAEGRYAALTDSTPCPVEICGARVLLPENTPDGQISVWLQEKL